jgi:hypothetical protein
VCLRSAAVVRYFLHRLEVDPVRREELVFKPSRLITMLRVSQDTRYRPAKACVGCMANRPFASPIADSALFFQAADEEVLCAARMESLNQNWHAMA